MDKNILAVCGSKNSGKTTLLKMMIYCIETSTVNPTLDNYNIYGEGINLYFHANNKNVQVLNFADSLKEQIIALTGCNMKQLEDQSFKQSLSPLPILYWNNPFKVLPKEKFYTYRQLLELISDETKRKFGEQVYVNSLFSKHDPTKHLIIGDLRYSKNTPENEEGEIKKRGGIIIKLERPNLEGDFSHSSESSIKDIEADFEHVNENLEDLFNLAKRLVEQYLK